MGFIMMAVLVIGTSALIRYIYLETKISSHIADSTSDINALDRKLSFFIDQLNIMKSDMCRRFKEVDSTKSSYCEPCKEEEKK